VAYFILPIGLSFPTPFFFFAIVIVTIAAMTDPICPQWLELNWVDCVGRVILLVGFVGMCCRKEWALWLTVIVQILYILWIWGELCTSEFRKDGLFLFMMSIYCLLVVIACLYALWQCAQLKRNSFQT